jgi:hypothetical protein
MPPLDDPRQEKFAIYLHQGLLQKDAYEKAGYKYHEGNASRLAHSEKIETRLRELHQQDALVAGLSKSFVLGGLMYIAGKHTESNPAASVAAFKLLGQTAALELFTEKSKQDISLLDLISKATPEDKVKVIQELTARLGLTTEKDLLDG